MISSLSLVRLRCRPCGVPITTKYKYYGIPIFRAPDIGGTKFIFRGGLDPLIFRKLIAHGTYILGILGISKNVIYFDKDKEKYVEFVFVGPFTPPLSQKQQHLAHYTRIDRALAIIH